MALSTILNLFFIPVLYVILKTLLGKFKRDPKALKEPCDDEVPPPEPAH
jgi:HAE1 family hydrophobic/amphiphilic exporter-1